MERNEIKGLQLRTMTTLLARLKAGFFIREIVENFASSNHSLRLYSAHDTTIIDVLNSLGLFDASFNFDFYEDEDANEIITFSGEKGFVRS